MRSYLDEDLSDPIAIVGRSQFGLDITSVHELALNGLDDDAQFWYATGALRCIVTRNGKHFIALTERYAAQRLPHAGVLVVPRSL